MVFNLILTLKGGRKPISGDLKTLINSHMETLSTIASNRFLIKLNKNALYCSVSLLEAYSKFNQNISFSTFYKYVGNEFKKPYRFTDLCEYCEHYKVSYDRKIKFC